MALADITSRFTIMIEAVAPGADKWFRDALGTFSQMYQSSTDVKKINRKLWRYNVQPYPAGIRRKMSLTSGVYGSGNAPEYFDLHAGFIVSTRAYQIDEETVESTKDHPQAIVDTLSDMLSGAMDQVALDDESDIFGDGSGTLTNPCSYPVATGAGTSVTQVSFAAVGDYLRTGKLREGMALDFWSYDLTTKRAPTSGSAPTIIKSIDDDSATINLSQAVTICPAGSQDIAAVPELDAYGPASLTTGASTWPDGTPLAGIGGDSWRHGIYYGNSVDDTTYFLGRSRATYPQLKSNRVNAINKPITWAMGRLLADKIQIRTRQDLSNLRGVAPLAQRAQIEELGISISSIQIPMKGSVMPMVDLASNGQSRTISQSFVYAGIEHDLAVQQPAHRIDWIRTDKQVRTELSPTEFVKGGDTGIPYLHRQINGNGERMTSFLFWIKQAYDIFPTEPRLQGYIDNLKVPSGYAGVA